MTHLPARTTDPETSWAAAEHVTSTGIAADQQTKAAKAVRTHPGLTSLELSKAAGICRFELARRLPEAEKRHLVIRGAVRKCGVSGRSAATWWVEPQQLSWVA